MSPATSSARGYCTSMSQHESGYEGRIGRYGPTLATALMRAAGVRRGQRALDVGCGTER